METLFNISQDIDKNDQLTIEHQVFEQFLMDYQPVLVKVEKYLEKVIDETDCMYREAYMPWKKALHELLEGAYYLAKKIPLPSKEEFMDALFMFSFKSTISFLSDICSICQLKLKNEWEKEFQDKINMLLFALSGQTNKPSLVA